MVLVLETGSHIAQADLELTGEEDLELLILLPRSPLCQGAGLCHCLLYAILGTEPQGVFMVDENSAGCTHPWLHLIFLFKIYFLIYYVCAYLCE